jgi:hypothetical protein
MLLWHPGCAGGGLGATAAPGEQQQAPGRDGGEWGALANALGLQQQLGSNSGSWGAAAYVGVHGRRLEI